MVNILNAENKRLAKRLESLKNIEERNVAFLAISFQIYKSITGKQKIEGTIDPLFISLVKEYAYTLNELTIVSVDDICLYANKFLQLKFFRFDSNLDSATCVNELFGLDLILGENLLNLWNSNFVLFKEISDLYYVSEIFSTSENRVNNKTDSGKESSMAGEAILEPALIG